MQLQYLAPDNSTIVWAQQITGGPTSIKYYTADPGILGRQALNTKGANVSRQKVLMSGKCS